MIFKTKTYDQYANKCCKELQKFQDSFKAKYDIDNYDNWFYTQASEIIRLYSADKEIHFKYIPIGSFSRNTNTWMWAWANNDSIESRKLQTLKVKEFGQNKGYDNLINDYFEGDEYTGWELASITFKLLEGIGVYRIVSDHLEKYFLLTNEISKTRAEEIESTLIECDTHGKSRSAFICQHLNIVKKTGFEEAFETQRGMLLDKDDELQSWCSECEQERIRTDGWNDESMEFAKIKIVCEGCYFDIKEFNISE
jgi:hypothetical protein